MQLLSTADVFELIGLEMQHFANGDVLTAGFVDGMANGKGRIEYANGDFFEGRFVND